MNFSMEPIYDELDKISTWHSYKEGIYKISEGNSYLKTIALKITASAALALSIGSYAFGCMALQEGIEEYYESSKAAVIGHFSEWTLLSFFLFEFICTVPHEISLLGRQSLTHKVFHRHLTDDTILPEAQQELYDIYCDYIANNTGGTKFINISGVQRPTDPMVPSERNIAVDSRLGEFFEGLSQTVNNRSFWKEFLRGLSVLEKNSGFWRRVAYQSAVLGGAILLAVHLPNYALGIFWASEQAVEDYHAGFLPTIGGHSIEWTVEVMGLLAAYYALLREGANVGRADTLSELFREELAKHELSSIEAKRLLSEMRRLLASVPDGLLLRKSLVSMLGTGAS